MLELGIPPGFYEFPSYKRCPQLQSPEPPLSLERLGGAAQLHLAKSTYQVTGTGDEFRGNKRLSFQHHCKFLVRQSATLHISSTLVPQDSAHFCQFSLYKEMVLDLRTEGSSTWNYFSIDERLLDPPFTTPKGNLKVPRLT